MAAFAGFDISNYLGDAMMAWIKGNTNAVWCGYYLGPAPSHPEINWMGRRSQLQQNGWGLAPTYLGQELSGPGSHLVNAAQGAVDGAGAATLMRQDGFAPLSTVYLDLEDGAPFVEPRVGYVEAWARAVNENGYKPGFYCSHGIASAVHQSVPEARIWAFKVDISDTHPYPDLVFPDPAPNGCGYPAAFAWQLEQNCVVETSGAPAGKIKIDLSTANLPDPGAP